MSGVIPFKSLKQNLDSFDDLEGLSFGINNKSRHIAIMYPIAKRYDLFQCAPLSTAAIFPEMKLKLIDPIASVPIATEIHFALSSGVSKLDPIIPLTKVVPKAVSIPPIYAATSKMANGPLIPNTNIRVEEISPENKPTSKVFLLPIFCESGPAKINSIPPTKEETVEIV